VSQALRQLAEKHLNWMLCERRAQALLADHRRVRERPTPAAATMLNPPSRRCDRLFVLFPGELTMAPRRNMQAKEAQLGFEALSIEGSLLSRSGCPRWPNFRQACRLRPITASPRASTSVMKLAGAGASPGALEGRSRRPCFERNRQRWLSDLLPPC
jgi:hypothetical protein